MKLRLRLLINLVSFLFTATANSTQKNYQIDRKFDVDNVIVNSENSGFLQDQIANGFSNGNIGDVQFLSILHQSFRSGEESCIDKKPQDCEAWSKLGYCKHSKSSYQSWMEENCPLSCKICTVEKENEECDLRENKNEQDCKEWAKLGYCNHKIRRYRTWMSENCPNSCKTCKPKVEETCRDRRDNCNALRSFCASRFRSVMLSWCPNTCKACTSISVSKSSGQSIPAGNRKSGIYYSKDKESASESNVESCFPVKCGVVPKENRRKRNADSELSNIFPRITLKIVGGARAMRGRWPWHGMLLQKINNRVRFCGITIICKHWLVTAAHCLVSRNANLNVTREKLDTYTIYVGRLQGPYGHSDSVTQEFGSEKIEKVVVHHYFRHSPYFAHDIALIKLKKSSPIKFNYFVQPLCLPETNDLEDGDKLTTYGWGITKGYGPSPDRLKEVILPFVPHEQCRRRIWGLYDRGTLCAGGTRNTDTCTGDSGGSLIKRKKKTSSTQDNRFYFYGITSYGSRNCNTRAPYNPGVYTDVAFYHNWIKQQTKGCCD